MAVTIIHMYGSSSGGTENALASIDIPEDGRLIGAEWAVNADLDADGENIYSELSFIATNQDSTNDARGVISSVAARISLTTSGVAMTSINRYTPLDLDVAGGERLYLHVLATAGVTAGIRCNVHLETRRAAPRRSQRRR